MSARPTDIRALRPDDAEYPANLRACPRPPTPIWIRGTLMPADERAVAIAGTRHPSDDGRRRARRLATALAREGVTVVSGLALGVDAEAHAAALAAGGRTLAVLGHGLALPITPRANTHLAERVIRHGALVSPFPLATVPTPETFRARNAVIAALARVTVVIEAGQRSGARILVRVAADQHRPVLLARSLLATEPWAARFTANRHAHTLDHVDDVLRLLDDPLPPTDTQLAL